MSTVCTSAMSRRMTMLLPTRFQRRRGVADRRLRMSFSRCSTSGMALKMPSCMSAMARMLGTK